MAIVSFKSPHLERLFAEQPPGKGFPPDLVGVTVRKLALIAAATKPEDLRSPPANRLEALKGDRQGTFSIRMNDQFRICFGWSDGGATDVDFVDYH